MSGHVFTVWKEFRFDAAQQLDAGAGGDPRQRRVHGHSYQGGVWVRGPLTEHAWVADMGDLERRISVVRDALDHRMLNDVEGPGTPTMENIASFVREALGDWPQLQRVIVKRGQRGEGCGYFGPGGV
jgi:6-pyruvoyltetrahydropterin/6-carboxytetrahydropterin synthase